MKGMWIWRMRYLVGLSGAYVFLFSFVSIMADLPLMDFIVCTQPSLQASMMGTLLRDGYFLFVNI